MKQHIYMLALSALPFSVIAQPTLNKVEDYTAGTSVKMLNAQAMAAGNAGANQTWNFATLTGTDTTTYTYMVAAASSAFPAATLVEKSSDSTYRFFNKTAATTHIIGIADSSTSSDQSTITYSNTMQIAMRPLSYNATYADSFEHTIVSGMFTVTGKGEIKTKVDGYGTLVLPNGTYNNVLRVRSETIQRDTIGAPLNMAFTSTFVSYTWYDNLHKAPLLRVDSMDAGGSPDVEVYYLHKETYPVSISSIETKSMDMKAFFNNGQLELAGAFENGKPYSVQVFDLAGRTIHTEQFTATSKQKTIRLQNSVPAGIYMVSVLQPDTKTAGYVKVAKDH